MKQLHIRNMNAQTSEANVWKLLCQHVTPNNIVFIKKNNTCARIKFVHHEYADIARKNLDGKYISIKNVLVLKAAATRCDDLVIDCSINKYPLS